MSSARIVGMVDLRLPSDWTKFHADNVAKIAPDKRDSAVKFLRELLADQAESIKAMIAKTPGEWWVEHHHGGMMNIRNELRGAGFGEPELGIDNLDDYAVGLVELAMSDAV